MTKESNEIHQILQDPVFYHICEWKPCSFTFIRPDSDQKQNPIPYKVILCATNTNYQEITEKLKKDITYASTHALQSIHPDFPKERNSNESKINGYALERILKPDF